MDSEQLQSDFLDQEAREFYSAALKMMNESEVPFLLGGVFAFAHYSGIYRQTKDLDVFIRERDVQAMLAAMERAGFRSEITYPHWLAKAWQGEMFIDLIFKSGNAVSIVDDSWFEHAVEAKVLGVPVLLCPAEEMLWSKAFVQERERYDGADVAHLVRGSAEQLDWRRLIDIFGAHWRVLFSQLVLFGFVYPGERNRVPTWVLSELSERLLAEQANPVPDEKLCQGTMISREQYLVDTERWGYRDGRLLPNGNMTAEQIASWTAAIEH